MEGFLSTLSLHSPLYSTAWGVTNVLIGAALAGLVLGLFCRLFFGAFLVWGLVVGFVGTLFLWLIVSVLALKWAILVFGAIALIIFAGFYLDDHAPVTGEELVHAAQMRNLELADLFERDPGTAESLAESLNRGLDQFEPRWPAGSAFAGVPKRVTRNIRYMLTVGFTALAALALIFWFLVPQPELRVDESAVDKELMALQSSCGALSGIEEERCLLNITADLERQITSAIKAAESAVYDARIRASGAGAELPIDEWRKDMQASNELWLAYRNSTCYTIKYLTYLGSGTGRFIARCRLRMTHEYLQLIKSYASGYPSY